MSKNILVIQAHDDMNVSRVNKRFSKEIEALDNVEIRDLKALYPDFKIDIEAEQEAIRKADKIVFQFPMFWFNAPSILKEWMDKVYAIGFAFDVSKEGYERRELNGKEFMLAVSMGGHEAAYSGDYKSVDECLTPYIYTSKFCGMKVVEPFYTYRAMQNLSDEKLEELAPLFKAAILK
ncbi:MAG: NAD(P)H-dependent oxidoreductase [Halarcobacter sp.]